VMTPSPADDHNARWRTLMRQEDHPNIELMRERRNRNQCPICSTQAPKIGRSAVPQLHYCESCSFPFHVYVS
jgi:ribosomal protein L37AE/L43A